ncbi:MAG: fumarylacetoacetate hydrolase family protein, partial [Microbacterium gubbeenense]
MTRWIPDAASVLPDDADSALLVGRAETAAGPSVVVLRGGELIDVSRTFPTMRELTERADPASAARGAEGMSIGSFADVWANTDPATRDASRPFLLSPIDLHVVKAAGVTFPVSMLERMI